MPSLKSSLFALLVVTCGVAVVTDVRQRRIPDALTYPAMVLALGLRGWLEGVGDAWTGLVSGAAGLGVCVAWFGAFAAFGRRSLGWGDVKLAGVMGGALGLGLTPAALLFVSLAGAFQAIVSLLWEGALSDTVRRVFSRRVAGEGGANPQRHIPYGVAIALGSAWAMWWEGNAFV